MAKITAGYDPAPPGKYPIETILVDSDLDGIASGAMLRLVYPEAQIVQGEATGMQLGTYSRFINKHTAIADLKYIEGCGLYFDHHLSNRPDYDHFPGRWQDADSATRVVYEYFRTVADLQKFEPIVKEVDKFDMGHITLAEFLDPSPEMALGMTISRDDENFNLLLLELMAHQQWQNVLNHYLVKSRIDSFTSKRDQISKHIHSHSHVKEGLAFVDLTEYDPQEKVSSYVIVSQFPDADAAVVFKNDPDQYHKVRLYRNNFNTKAKDIDLLTIALAINPEHAGGHKVACGFIWPEGKTMQEVEKLVLQELSKQK